MVDDAAVGLLGKVLVKTSVARLHVEDRYFQALGGNRGQGGIGVAQNQQCVRILLPHQAITPGNDISNRFSQIGAYRFQIKIRLAKPKVLKKDLV